MTNKRSFLHIGIIYAAGQFLLQAVSFLLLPLYTWCLTVSEYGQFALTATVSDITGFVMVLGIYSGYNRFYKEYGKERRSRLKNTALTFSLLIGSLSALAIIMSENLIALIVPGLDNFFTILLYIVLNNLFTQISYVFICDYYLEYHANKIVVINLVKALWSALLTVYFIALLKEGIAGIYKGQMISSFCLLFYFIYVNRKQLKLELDKNMLSKMLRFGAGLIPSNLSASLLNFSDRFFMAGYRSYSETGIYSVGYKFGMQIDPLFTTPFRQLFTTYKYEIWKDRDACKNFNDMFLKYHFIGCLAILCVALYSRTAILLFTSAEYMPAYKIVPLVLVSYFLYGKSRFYNLGIELKNKTYLDSVVLISGGLVNLILNLVLIPRLGMYGAAFATLISYMLINILYSKISGPLYRISYDIKKPCIVCLTALLLYAAYFLFSLAYTVILFDIILGIILPAVYILLCILFKIINSRDIHLFIRSLSSGARSKTTNI